MKILRWLLRKFVSRFLRVNVLLSWFISTHVLLCIIVLFTFHFVTSKWQKTVSNKSRTFPFPYNIFKFATMIFYFGVRLYYYYINGLLCIFWEFIDHCHPNNKRYTIIFDITNTVLGIFSLEILSFRCG